MRIGTVVILGGAVFGLVIGTASVINPPVPDPTPNAPPAATPAAAPNQADSDPSAGFRQWDSYLDGNKILCYESKSSHWFMVIPTPQQHADGEVMRVNENPSDAAWQMSCSKQPVVGQW